MIWNKWVIRGLICALLAILLAGLAVFAYWTTPSAIRQMVQQQTGLRFQHVVVQVGSARLRLLGGVVVRELRLARSLGLDRGDFLYSPSLILYHDKQLILDDRKFALRKVEMDRPQIRIIRQRDGQLNISGLLGEPNLKERLPIVVIRDGTLTFEDHSAPASPVLEIRKLQLTLCNDPLSTLTVEGKGEVDVFGPVRLRGTINRATQAAKLELVASSISVNDELWRRVRMFFPAVGHHLGQLHGEAEAVVKLNLPGNGPTLEASVPFGHEVAFQFRKGTFSHPRLPLPLEQIQLEAKLINGVIPSARLTARLGSTEGTSATVVSLRPSAVPSAVGSTLEIRLKDFQIPSGAVEFDVPSLHRMVREFDVELLHLSVTDAILAALPEYILYLKDDFSPNGPLSVRYRYRRPGKDSTSLGPTLPDSPTALGCKEWTIDLEGMSGKYKDFMYPLHNVRGTVWLDTMRENMRNIRIDLSALGMGAASATLKGTIQGERTHSAIDLRLVATEVPLDDAILNSLSRRVQEIVGQFLPAASRQLGLASQPMGKADVVADFIRKEGQERVDKTFKLQIKDASVLYNQFPLPIEGVSGLLELYPDHWECKGFRGRRGPTGGEVSFWGRSHPVPTAPGVRGVAPVLVSRSPEGPPASPRSETIEIHFVGNNIPVDEELERAMRPLSGPDRQGLQSAWRTLQLGGRMHFVADVIDHADSPQDLDVRVKIEGPSMKPAFFKYALNGVSGQVEYSRGQVTLTRIQGSHGDARLELGSGVIRLGTEGGFTAWLTGLTARELPVDSDLLGAMPESLRQVFEPLRLKTPVEIATNITLRSHPAASRPNEVWWEGALGLHKARFRAGVDVADATGQLFCKGYHDGSRLRGVTTQLRIKQATVLDQPLRNLTARLEVEPGSSDIVRIRDLRADLFGGTLHGEGRLESGSALKYDLNINAVGIQLEEFGKHNLGKDAATAQLQGPAHASLHLEGKGHDLLGLRGNGRVDVPKGKMGQLPVFLDLFKAFGGNVPDKTAFESAKAIFAIEGPQVLVRDLDLVGNALSLHGQGKLDIDGSNIALDFSATPLRSSIVPNIDYIPGLISGQILKIKMRGKFGKDGGIRYDKEFMPGVLEPIKKVFEGGT